MNAPLNPATKCWSRRRTDYRDRRRRRSLGGTPRHYLCDEQNGGWFDLDDIRAKITPATWAIVVINPNNPTGALYSDELLLGNHRHRPPAQSHHLCRRDLRQGALRGRNAHRDGVVVRGRADHQLQRPVEELPLLRLSRHGMVVSGDKREAKDYIEGLDMLASMRLCANVPAQYWHPRRSAATRAFDDLVAAGGRLRRWRTGARTAHRDPGRDLRQAEGGAVHVPAPRSGGCIRSRTIRRRPRNSYAKRRSFVQGSGFNWPHPDHFRVVFLPHEDELREAIQRLARFLEGYRKRHGR